MKKRNFYKMNGSGNDFILMDNRDSSLNLSKEKIVELCHRQKGIGADGLLLVEKGRKKENFRFRYYNADGKEVAMCGNGARCFSWYVSEILLNGKQSSLCLETGAGDCKAEIFGREVRIEMPKVEKINLNLEVDKKQIHFLNTGVPHVVEIVENLEKLDVKEKGSFWRYHPYFSPEGTNANFVCFKNSEIQIRTYERGVEEETLACGTGAVASAIICSLLYELEAPLPVCVRNGDKLIVDFEKTGNSSVEKIKMTGPTELNYIGQIRI